MLGVSVHTLRYYEREGLLSVPRHDALKTDAPRTDMLRALESRSAQRRYGHDELGLLRFLLALRATGMPMVLIRRYMALVRAGEQTVPERRLLLTEHEQAVTNQIAALGQNLKAIAAKIEKYDRTEGCGPERGPAQGDEHGQN